MTNDVDYHALAVSAAILLLPIISTVVSIGGAAWIMRRTVQRIHALRDDSQHWRDETYALWQEVIADTAVQSKRSDKPERPLAVHNRTIDEPSERPGRDAVRLRATGPVAPQWPGRDLDAQDRLAYKGKRA
ncbi:hypothetical protein G3I59_13795 [Amycolatopsis rubida]|uniref:Uncharacterized protein n=1 Tax=Amycolatopsis rubida TaxID=112413 RepID=A0ABX0BLY7_9PSEU|nr:MULTISPECIES: hypothetical protein [Amycolatopsis]MYW91648.1 hypothetical protein [Amycolatopsis rubida]NEC56632.1 hypothetical protein [Amycolatopsis rubida]OAP24455.1 hypothetical protein A4R44_04846 [Amycolatopsis sp. M39]